MDLELIKDTVVGFVREHQAWAPVVVAGLAFGESLVFLSLLTPATIILVAIGVLIGAAGLEFWPFWLSAALGAASGDWLSYEIGRRFKTTAYRIWPLSHHPGLVTRGETFFSRYGPWGLFAGRFFGPARAVVPLISGIFAMPLIVFMAVNLASASVWAFVLLAPGAGLADFMRW